MSGATILISETGDFRGAAGVKTAKLCAEQDQIGKLHGVARILASGLIARGTVRTVSQRNDHHGLLALIVGGRCRQNPAYSTSKSVTCEAQG